MLPSKYFELRTDKFGRDAAMASKPELVYGQVREYRDRFPRKTILTGHAGSGPIPILMAGGASPVQAESTPPRDGGPRDDAALLEFVAENVADVLSQMKPVDDQINDGWCLTNNADCWLIYTASGSTIQLQRAIKLVAAQARWFNPSNGKTTLATLGNDLKITKPSNEAWLLLVRNH